ncbi:hypothetical protein Y1Q_0007743 [Alligator mississippiensis]|uniref:Ig-like domain-containing protein n=1 Tax=Alligator mississippiensis TaxID=8496 RepID=A0A151NCH7_ALLMI|nr:hypothetical protein Y1Q_0007743 [Alligator mississippiensis]
MIYCFNIAYFLLAVTGVQSKVEYVASGGTVKMLGDSLGISCTTSGIDFDNSWLGWVRHVPGRGLQQVAYISKLAGDTVYYSDAVKGRFTISRDNSRKLLHLQMSNLRPEDAAEYYCSWVAQCAGLCVNQDKNLALRLSGHI